MFYVLGALAFCSSLASLLPSVQRSTTRKNAGHTGKVRKCMFNFIKKNKKIKKKYGVTTGQPTLRYKPSTEGFVYVIVIGYGPQSNKIAGVSISLHKEKATLHSVHSIAYEINGTLQGRRLAVLVRKPRSDKTVCTACFPPTGVASKVVE